MRTRANHWRPEILFAGSFHQLSHTVQRWLFQVVTRDQTVPGNGMHERTDSVTPELVSVSSNQEFPDLLDQHGSPYTREFYTSFRAWENLIPYSAYRSGKSQRQCPPFYFPPLHPPLLVIVCPFLHFEEMLFFNLVVRFLKSAGILVCLDREFAFICDALKKFFLKSSLRILYFPWLLLLSLQKKWFDQLGTPCD